MLKPVDFSSTYCEIINSWNNNIIKPLDSQDTVNLFYLKGALIICELCIKDTIEQTKQLYTDINLIHEQFKKDEIKFKAEIQRREEKKTTIFRNKFRAYS